MPPDVKVKLAPSILAADFGSLAAQAKEAEAAGADYLHIDVMDGQFVPAISFGTSVTAAIRKAVKIPLDVHLMVIQPERHISDFAKAGANIITVHIEACPHIHRVVELIKEAGLRAGVALNPGTPLTPLEELLPYLDLVLVMTVNPGAGGQVFITSQLDKISRLRKELDRRSLNIELEVDGGINPETAPGAVLAGATVLVAGSAVFRAGGSVKSSMDKIRASYEKTASSLT